MVKPDETDRSATSKKNNTGEDTVADPRGQGLNILGDEAVLFKVSILFLFCRRLNSEDLSIYTY